MKATMLMSAILLVLLLAGAAQAEMLEQNHNPSPDSLQDWNRFKQQNADAEVAWGDRFGRPYMIWGMTPVPSGGDYDRVVREVMAQNPELFGTKGKSGRYTNTVTLGEGEVFFRFRYDEVKERLEEMGETELEPRGVDTTFVRFKQYIDGILFLDGMTSAIFDADDSLISLSGEYPAGVEAITTPSISEEQAMILIKDYMDVDDELHVYDVKYGLKFFGDIVPAYVISGLTEKEKRDYTFIIDADAAVVAKVNDNVDYAPGDDYERLVWGYTMDEEASITCNEPAKRSRWVDNTYASGWARAAFNPDVHVYDMAFSYPTSTKILYPLYSNQNSLFVRTFNHQITNGCSGGICRNDVNAIINRSDISTFTTFNLTLQQFAQYTSWGYDKDGTGSPYPDEHNLTVIVNRRKDIDIDGGGDLCGPNTNSCFRKEGFPNWETTGYYDENEEWIPQTYDDFTPTYSVDRYFNGPDQHPTIVIENWVRSGELYTGMIYPPLLFHEFNHYIYRRYNQDGGGYSRPDDFLGDEGEAIREGFAYYMDASLNNENEYNYYRRRLHCTSDDVHDGISDVGVSPVSKTWNLQYGELFQCCDDGHNAGYLVTQILWDLREGIGLDDALGKDYVDLLVFTTMALSGGWQNDMNMRELYINMASVAIVLGSDECPIGIALDCGNLVEDAFNRHGVCTDLPCFYLSRDCDSNCDGALCMRGKYDNCEETYSPSGDRCGDTTDKRCCEDTCNNLNIDGACDLYDNDEACESACTYDLWSHAKRECMNYLSAGDCDACDDL
jgi:hypothetical protein